MCLRQESAHGGRRGDPGDPPQADAQSASIRDKRADVTCFCAGYRLIYAEANGYDKAGGIRSLSLFSGKKSDI